MKKDIYCPICLEKGEHKLIGRFKDDHTANGTVYLWCKKCKQEVPVQLYKLRSKG